MSHKIIVCTLTFVMLLSSLSAYAAVEFHPSVMVGEEYNDNIYLADQDEEEDWITTIQPGISLLFSNRSVDITATYSLLYRFYKNNDQENEDRFEDVQRAEATAEFFSGRPFTLSATQTIAREVLDERDDIADYNDLEERSTVYRTSVTPAYRYQITPTFSSTAAYTYNLIVYVEPEGIDTQEHIGRMTLDKSISSRLDVYLAYVYSYLDSDEEAEELTRQDYNLGFTYQLGSRTHLNAEGGYSEVEYDSGYTTDATNYLIDLTYATSEALSYFVRYAQDFTVTATEGLAQRQEFSAGTEYSRDSMTANVRGFWRDIDYVRQDRNDEIFGFDVGMSKPLSRAYTLNLQATYENARFEEVYVEDVNRYIAELSLSFDYRRFVLETGYRYRVNDSEVDTNDYVNNIIYLNGSVRF